MVKRPGWELTVGTGKSTSESISLDDERSMWDTLNCSFIEGWCGGGVRSVCTGVYPGCKYGVWVLRL